MLKIAYCWLLNAQIARTAIWISSWKLYFSSASAAWLRGRRSLHCPSFDTLTCRRRGIGGAGTILPCCCCRSLTDDATLAIIGPGFCSSSRSVYAGRNFTKHHDTKSPLQRPHDHSSLFEPCALIYKEPVADLLPLHRGFGCFGL